MGSNEFLLQQPELEERCLTNGYQCYPICVGCLGADKKIETLGKKNELKARQERERKALLKKK